MRACISELLSVGNFLVVAAVIPNMETQANTMGTKHKNYIEQRKGIYRWLASHMRCALIRDHDCSSVQLSYMYITHVHVHVRHVVRRGTCTCIYIQCTCRNGRKGHVISQQNRVH